MGATSIHVQAVKPRICRFLNEPEGRELLDELDFPETHKLLYAIAFGYPDEEPSPKPRDMNRVRTVE